MSAETIAATRRPTPFDASGVPDRPSPDFVIELAGVRTTLRRGLRLSLEAAIVPAALLYCFLHTLGTVAALAAVLAWCALTVVVRWSQRTPVPRSFWLCVAMLAGRSAVALALSSVYLYLLQPAIGSVLMGLVFLGSAAIGRPVTVQLARDFVRLPAQLFTQDAVRHVFSQVSVLWGGTRLLDAAMSIGLLRIGIDTGLLSRGLLSGLLTITSIAGCAFWGWRRLRRNAGVRVSVRWAADAAT